MLRNEFSYWLEASLDPDMARVHAPDQILAALNQSPLADDGGFTAMWFRIEDDTVRGEVDPNKGTVEEDSSFSDYVAEIAALFPDYKFSFDECDEEDKSNKTRTTWVKGKQEEISYARTLEPGSLDPVTLRAAMNYLKDDGFADAADAVAKRFGNDLKG